MTSIGNRDANLSLLRAYKPTVFSNSVVQYIAIYFDKIRSFVYDIFIKSKEASKMIDLQKWAEQYLLICKYQKGLDTKTIKAYRIDISQFIEFAKLKRGN